MAEVFGTVASALAVAELLVKSVFKIKKLWDEVQDVPEEINRLIKELELLSPVIGAVEAVYEQQKHLPLGSIAGPIILACREVVGHLETLSAELQDQIFTARRPLRNITKLKVTFRKDWIRVHQEKLKSIVKALSLSLQAHSVSQQTHIM
ncbi:uncharacterized protein CTRU02_203347 [Colletotrichum truncatum]|uniref:Uncharacterized protein n=1 Tax=Colletotrichum truncatum TaxID=5467 RepID=A0ACC3Z924_COLTU